MSALVSGCRTPCRTEEADDYPAHGHNRGTARVQPIEKESAVINMKLPVPCVWPYVVIGVATLWDPISNVLRKVV